jgi:hypothetical protein
LGLPSARSKFTRALTHACTRFLYEYCYLVYGVIKKIMRC